MRDYIRTRYGLKNPWSVINRIRKISGYEYDEDNNRFSTPYTHNEEQIFMSIDDLCGVRDASNGKVQETAGPSPSAPVSMDKLIHELISDRLLELSKYVTLETSSRKILIDRTSMAVDGYNVEIH